VCLSVIVKPRRGGHVPESGRSATGKKKSFLLMMLLLKVSRRNWHMLKVSRDTPVDNQQFTYDRISQNKNSFCFFFKEIYWSGNQWHKLCYKKLQNCSLNQFSLVVARCASDGVSALLGCYWCSSEKQARRKNTAANSFCKMLLRTVRNWNRFCGENLRREPASDARRTWENNTVLQHAGRIWTRFIWLLGERWRALVVTVMNTRVP
jgi:hypothetical protein